MLSLAFRNLRARPARTIFTAMAIALGVAMIFAAQIVGAAVEASAATGRSGRLAGADLEISGVASGPFDQVLAERVAARPEVAAAAPVLRRLEGRITTDSAVVLVAGDPEGTGLALLGVDPANTLARYELSAGTFFSSTDAAEVLLPATWATGQGLIIGDSLSLTTGETTADYQVIGLLASDLQGAFTDKPTAWLPLVTMQQAFAVPNSASAVLVQLKPGITPAQARSGLATFLGRQYVVANAADDGRAATIFDVFIDAALPFASLAVVLAGAFLVYNAFAITMAERRRELAQLRALGATRRQIRLLVLSESTFIALLGGLPALAVGWLLGQGMVYVTVVLLQEQRLPAPTFPLGAALLALGGGLVIALATTFQLAAQASKVSPLAALRDDVSTTEAQSPFMRWSWLGGVVLVAAFGALFAWIKAGLYRYEDGLAVLVLPPFLIAAAALLALPLAVRVTVAILRWLAPRFGVAGRLALGSIERRMGRATLTAATMCIGLMLVVTLSGLFGTIRGFQEQGFTSIFQGDFLLVRPVVGTSFYDLGRAPSPPPIEPGLQADLAALNDRAEVLRMGLMQLPGYGSAPEIEQSFALDFAILRNYPDFDLVEGSWEDVDTLIAAGEHPLIVPLQTARRRDLAPGDLTVIETAEGPITFTIGLVGGVVPSVTAEDGVRYFGANPLLLLVNAREGTDHDQLEQQLARIAKENRMVLTNEPASVFRQSLDASFALLLGLFNGLTSLSALIGGLGIANTLSASILERQRELGTLRALGASRRQVRAAVTLEAAAIGLAGAAWGVLGGLAAGAAFSVLAIGYAAELGVPGLQVSVPWLIALVALLVGPLLAALAAFGPADRAASVNPAEAMRAEGAAGFLAPAERAGPTGLRGFVAHMPLAVKLALTLSLVFSLTIATLTAVRAQAERRLLEDNVISLIARQSDLMVEIVREEFPVDLTRIDPRTLADLRKRFAGQAALLQSQFQGGRSPYEFGLKYYLLADAEGRVVDSDQPQLIGKVLSDTLQLNGSGTQVRLTDWTGERVFEGSLPLERRDGTRIGTSMVGISTEPVDNIVADIVRGSLWTMLVGLLAALLLTWLVTRRALNPLAVIVEATRAIASGDLSRRIPENRYDEIGRLARSFNEMVRGLSERERLHDLFGRYLSREVSDAVIAGNVTLQGERREVTVLFCDMRDSTPFAEAHRPDEVMAALNQYFEVIIQATGAEGGIVARFLGDGAMCCFGTPAALPDHALCGLRSALRIRADVALLNRRREALGLPVLSFGMGLSSGDVTAGATGSEQRQEYTIIGDTVNLAARIESLTRQFADHDILLGEATRAALDSRAAEFRFIDLGEVAVKGKSALVRVYGVEV